MSNYLELKAQYHFGDSAGSREESRDALVHYKRVFAPWKCKHYFNRLDVTLPWEYQVWRSKPMSRRSYRPSTLEEAPILRQLALEVEQMLGCKVEGAWCNHYQNGSEHTPFHQDSYMKHVVTISFGATRRLHTKEIVSGRGYNTKYGPTEKHTIESGDLYYFSPSFDAKHQHAVPAAKRILEPRISVVFFTTPPTIFETPPNKWIIDFTEGDPNDGDGSDYAEVEFIDDDPKSFGSSSIGGADAGTAFETRSDNRAEGGNFAEQNDIVSDVVDIGSDVAAESEALIMWDKGTVTTDTAIIQWLLLLLSSLYDDGDVVLM